MSGFYCFRGLKDLNYSSSIPPVIESPVQSEQERLLDLIYTADPDTGFPSGAIEQYLSDKTSDQVRSFIERTILKEIPSGSSAIPLSLHDEVLKLDPEFIAKTARHRFESLDAYESRVESYFNEIEESKRKDIYVKELRKRFQNDKTES